MKNWRSISILKTWRSTPSLWLFGFLLIIQLFQPQEGFGRIFIDINSPSIQKINIAIPDFKDYSDSKKNPELAGAFPKVISNDLDLSGFFIPMEKSSFLDEDGPYLTADSIRFRNWSLIGTDLLLKGGYACIGRSLEAEVRLYDAFRGQQILGKKFLGKIDDYRVLCHRIGNEIIMAVTGYKGLFLSRFAFVNRLIGDNKIPSKEIFVCDFDGQNMEQVTFDGGIALLPRWSPKGDSIVYNSIKEGGTILYSKTLSSGKIRVISGRRGLNMGACWISDGKKLALALSNNDNPDIYVIDLQGKILKRLTSHWGIDVSPTFSPDETKMAFISDRSGSPQVYVKDLKTGNEERLTFPDTEYFTFESKYNSSPDWSARNQIAFSGDSDSGRDIYTVNPDGKSLKRLTRDTGNNEDPCWSPDGRYIVFSSDRDGGFHLYIMNANGQNQRRISFNKGEQTAPSWAPF